MLTHRFADERGLKVATPIVLDTPHGQHRFTVRAFLDPESIARMFQGNPAVMDLKAAHEPPFGIEERAGARGKVG